MKQKKLNKGIILSTLFGASKKLYKSIPNSMIGSTLCKERKKDTGLFSYLIGLLRFKKRVSTPFKRFMAKSFDKSVILNKSKQIISLIPTIQMRTIGLFFFALGLFCSVTGLLERGLTGMLHGISDITLPLLIAGVGGIFTLSQKSCYEALRESKILSKLIFDLFGIKKRDKYIDEPIITKGHIGFIVGIIAGVIATIFSPIEVLLFICSLLVIIAVMWTPESGVVIMFLMLPFASNTHSAILAGFVAFSWIMKLIRGKRTLKFGFLEFVLAALAVAIIFGGSISLMPKESKQYSLLLISGILGYLVIVNNIKTAEWTRRCMSSMLLSFGAMLICGTFATLSKYLESTRFSFIPEFISGRASEMFTYNSVFSIVCVALLPFFVLKIFKSTRDTSRSLYIILTAMAIYCLIIGHSSGAHISVTIGAIMLLLFYSPYSLGIITLSIIAVPATISLLPSSVSNYILGLFGITSQTVQSQITAHSLIGKNALSSWIGGIGLGDHNAHFIGPISKSSLPYVQYEQANTYMSMIIGLGVTGLIIFTIMVLVFARKFFSYIRSSRNDNPRLRDITICSFTGALSILIMGFTANIFNESQIFSMFFYLCAISVCAAKAAREERKEFKIDGHYIDITYDQSGPKVIGKEAAK